MDIEDEAQNLINTEIDYGDEEAETITNSAVPVSKEAEKKKEQASDQGILYPTIRVQEWLRECEKVSSKLKIDYKTSQYNSTEWRGHFEQCRSLNNVYL